MNCTFTGIHYSLRLFYRFCKILLSNNLKNHSYSFSIIIYLTNSLEKCPRISTRGTSNPFIYSENWISILSLTSLSLFPFIVGFLQAFKLPDQVYECVKSGIIDIRKARKSKSLFLSRRQHPQVSMLVTKFIWS